MYVLHIHIRPGVHALGVALGVEPLVYVLMHI